MNSEEVHLPAQRRRQIMQLLESQGQVLASELSQRFRVSEDTIRRDLRDMAKAGQVKRVHGGAVLRTRDAGELYHARQLNLAEVKQELAQKAVSLIRQGQVVILDAGTTNLEIARQLPDDLQITVITNCPPIAVALGEHPGAEVIMSGGRLQKSMQALTGADAVSTFQGINADICFIGACAIHSEYGLCASNDEEVHVKRAMFGAAAETVAVVTTDKLGSVEPWRIAPVKQLTYLIADQTAPEDVLAPFLTAGVSILQG